MNIIPTPQRLHVGSGSVPLSSCQIVKGLVAESAVIREYFQKHLKPQDRKHFEGSCGEQAYFLNVESKPQPRIIYGATGQQGLRYAEATLQQLRFESRGQDRIRVAEIVDWPDFEYRMNDWLIWAEIGCWSYDHGDGKRAFVRRIKDKLQWSADHKVNVILIDGFGWNAERFPGYGAMTRDLNAYARELGIHLMYSGYAAGYGAGNVYDGKSINCGLTFQNRSRYPNGKVYPCCGNPELKEERSRLMGTCLSNDRLMALKQQELRQFVQSVHPGALYIHNLDLVNISGLEQSWLQRCPRCKERWPNDDPLAPDGAAGAYAYHYDALTDTVFSIEDDQMGYKASRDCLVAHISPGYSIPEASDKEWDRHLQYFPSVSRYMRNVKNVYFGIREQFRRHNGTRLRFREMADAIQKSGKGHGLCAAVFNGCDAFYTDHLFSAAPSLNGLYRGAGLLMNCSGNAYQEPLQLLNSEFSWNSAGAALPRTYAQCQKKFDTYKDRKEQPQDIFGAQGFLGRACEALYGKDAGRHMRKVFSLTTSDDLSPLAHLTTKMTDSFGNPNREPLHRWGDDLPAEKAADFAKRWGRVEKITVKAQKAVQAALRAGPTDRAISDLAWYAKSLEIGAVYAKAAESYYQLYAKAQEVLSSGVPRKTSEIDRQFSELQSLTRKIAELLKSNFPRKMLDHMGGDRLQKQRALDFLRKQSREVARGAGTGQRGAKTQPAWW